MYRCIAPDYDMNQRIIRLGSVSYYNEVAKPPVHRGDFSLLKGLNCLFHYDDVKTTYSRWSVFYYFRP